MALRFSIIFSLFLHATVIATAVSVIGRDAVSGIPANYIMISLFKDAGAQLMTAQSDADRGRKKVYIKQNEASETPHELPKSNNTDLSSELAGISDDKADTNTILETSYLPYVIEGNGDDAVPVKLNNEVAGLNGANHAYALIRSAIEKAKVYPLLARKRRLEGTVITEFIINSNGLPENIRVKKGSGFDLLDSAAVNIITRAAPFPIAEGHIVIPITFSLTGNQ